MQHVVFYLAVAFAATAATIKYLYGAFVWEQGHVVVDDRSGWVNGGFVVFYSSKGMALAINAASGDPCTHIGIVFRLGGGAWLMVHADRPDTREDLTTGTHHDGVQVVALDHYLATSDFPPHFYAPPPPSGITVPEGDDLARFIEKTCAASRDGGYEPSLLRLVAVATSRNPTRTLQPFPRPLDAPQRPWFCSSLVAHIYQTWGWSDRTPPDTFHPKHFLRYLAQ